MRSLFNDKPKDYLFSNFEDFYNTTLDYFKDRNKTVVFDSAQYRNIKDYSVLKGNLIVMRTSIETCYERTLNRWKSKNKYNEEEYQKFANRKIGMFEWYHSLNRFLESINQI